jgi:hypothetical protein
LVGNVGQLIVIMRIAPRAKVLVCRKNNILCS